MSVFSNVAECNIRTSPSPGIQVRHVYTPSTTKHFSPIKQSTTLTNKHRGNEVSTTPLLVNCKYPSALQLIILLWTASSLGLPSFFIFFPPTLIDFNVGRKHCLMPQCSSLFWVHDWSVFSRRGSSSWFKKQRQWFFWPFGVLSFCAWCNYFQNLRSLIAPNCCKCHSYHASWKSRRHYYSRVF